jgi:hypothetical protein
VRSRLRDRGNDPRPLDLLATKKLRLQGCMACGGHRELIHGPSVQKNAIAAALLRAVTPDNPATP